MRGPLRFTMEIPLVNEDGEIMSLNQLFEVIDQLRDTLRGDRFEAPEVQHGDTPRNCPLTNGRGWCDVTTTERSANN